MAARWEDIIEAKSLEKQIKDTKYYSENIKYEKNLAAKQNIYFGYSEF